MKSLNVHFQEAWKEMGLLEKLTFTDVRTVMSAHGKNIHATEVRTEKTTYMCHSEATAEC